MLWIQGLSVVLLVQSREEIAVMPAVTAVLLHQSAMNTVAEFSVVSTGRGEIAVMPSVTAVLLHNSAMDTGAECSVVSTG